MRLLTISAVLLLGILGCKNEKSNTSEELVAQTILEKEFESFIDSLSKRKHQEMSEGLAVIKQDTVIETNLLYSNPYWSRIGQYLERKKLDTILIDAIKLIFNKGGRYCDSTLFYNAPVMYADSIYVERCHFNFFSDNLSGSILCANAQFNKPFIFANNSADGRITFDRCLFRDEVSYNKTDYSDESKSMNIPEIPEVQFISSIFKKGISFNSFYRDNYYSYEDKIVSKLFILNDSIDNLNFVNCVMGRKLDVSNLRFKQNALLRLESVFLPDTLDLSFTRLSGKTDLTRTYKPVSGNKCEINLLNTDVRNILMQYDNFHLFIPDSILNDTKSADVVSSTYESLLNSFKANGFQSSYKDLDIEYKYWQSKQNWTLKLSNWWWKFGYEKWRILLYSLGFIFLFSFYNFAKYKQLQEAYPFTQLTWSRIPYTKNPVFRTLKRYFVALMYTGIIFFRFSIDYKNVNIKTMYYVAIIILQYTIGLFCTGFMINWILG